MSRYIDADALTTHIKNMPWKMTSVAEIARGIFLLTVEEAPTADVVEVVRCKDCVHKGDAFCMAGDFPLTKENENCYCSYGERREG